MDNYRTVYLLKKIIKLKKEAKKTNNGMNITTMQWRLNHDVSMGYISQIDYDNLEYFYKKLLTNTN